MFTNSAPHTAATEHGQVTVDLTHPMVDFLADLAIALANDRDGLILGALSDLASILAEIADDPGGERERERAAQRLHDAEMTVLEALNLPDSLLLYMPRYTAAEMASHLETEAKVAELRRETSAL